jgi:outer membrane lipoprotein SlyB
MTHSVSHSAAAAALLVLVVGLAGGCRSPYYADRGALFGGLTGAGVGAVVGDATGHPGAGAVIGSAVGAITGAAVGSGIDADVARSKAEIEARLGRQMQGAVTPQDVIAMTQAGLSDDVIVTHIRANGLAQPLQVNDLIGLRNVGVRDSVINAMQQTPPRIAQVTQAVPAYPAYPGYPAPVVVERYYQPWPPPPPPAAFYYRSGPHGRAGWGVSVWP